MKNIFSKCLSLLLAVLLTQTTVPTIAQTAEVDLDDESSAAYREQIWKKVKESEKLARQINLMGYLHWICSRSIEYGNEGNDLELNIYFAVSDYEFGSDRTVRAVMSAKEYEALLKRTVREEDLLGYPKGDVSISFYFDADRELSDTDMINIMDILSEGVWYDQEKVNIDEVHKTLKKSSISNDEKMKLVYLTMANIVMDEFWLTDEYGLGLLDVLEKRGEVVVDNKLYSDKHIFDAMDGEVEPSPVTGMIDEFIKDKPKTNREIDEFVTSIMEGDLYFEYYPIPRRYVKKYYDRLIRARINGEEIDPFLLHPSALENAEVFGDDDDDDDDEIPEQLAAIEEENPFSDIELPDQGNMDSKKLDESGYLLYSNVDTFTYENGKKNIALKLYLSASDEDYGSKRTARAKLSATEYKELLAKYVTEEKFKDLSVPDKDVSLSLFYEFDEDLDDDSVVHLLDAIVNKHPDYNINIDEVHKTLNDPNVSDDDKKVLTYATLAKATLNLETLPDYYKLALVNVIQERGKIAVDEKPFAAVNSATNLLPLLIVLPIVLLGVASFFALKKNRSGKSRAQK